MNHERTSLSRGDGSTLLTYVPYERNGVRFADLAEVGDAGPEAAAQAALSELSGWSLATIDDQLTGILVASGATIRRHAHVHSRDLRRDPAPATWAEPSLRDGLSLTPWDRPLQEIALVALTAYPEGHPDFSPRADLAEVVARDLQPYAVDGALGPLSPASGLVVDDSAQRTVVALLLVNDREGVAPDGGPWVTEIARLPGTAYAGTGRALLQRAMFRLTAGGAPALSLAVTDGNPARGLYESLGIKHAYSARTLALPACSTPRG